MRYREGEVPGEVGAAVGNEMLLGAAMMGLVIGIVLFVLAVRGKQLWLAIWAAGLIVASVVYVAVIALGYG
ncbi:MAG: hypothetical protein JSW10_09160 [Pseudomonadota bacterium]|nr:MAG: hypothetical protein JSW10_09160 [Pseudomonadota bacterium]